MTYHKVGVVDKARIVVHTAILLFRKLRGKLEARDQALQDLHLSKGAVAIDIGAHCGSWSFSIARRFPHARVIAVEASPYYAMLLQAYSSLVGLKNLKILNIALSSFEGQLNLVTRGPSGKRLTGYSHLLRNGEEAERAETVTGRTLDSVAREHSLDAIQFIKCDVEGAELEVFKGAVKTLMRHKPLLYVEIDDSLAVRYNSSSEKVHQFLECIGYLAVQVESTGRRRPLAKEACWKPGDYLFEAK